MNDYDERSYKRYKQYRLNKYRYEQNQVLFPLLLILLGALVISIWRYILLAIGIILLIVLFLFFRKRYRSEQMRSVQELIISSEEARNGVKIDATVLDSQVETIITLNIPANTKNGQTYIAKNVEIQDASGKKKKVDIHFVIAVRG